MIETKILSTTSKIKEDLTSLITELSKNPEIGTPLGDNIFKVRTPNSSIPTGKRGGFRIVTYYKKDNTLYLITMYAKTQQDNILTNTLKAIFNEEIESK